MDGQRGRFVWYELLTMNMADAASFYGKVLGWSACDASATDFAYSVFATGETPVCGLMELPVEGRKQGATPRWVGYVAVDDADAVAEGFKRGGGAVYVPPTDSNIGRISIVADPQTATLALVERLKLAAARPRDLSETGCVGWHELFAADSGAALAFYTGVFGWQEGRGEGEAIGSYRLIDAGGQTIGGAFNKLQRVPIPFWLYYFNVTDLDCAIAAVQSGGGQVVHGPVELLGGISIIRCVDPQGAMFALRGPRGERATKGVSAAEFDFAAAWGGFASRGRVIAEPGGSNKRPKANSRAVPAKPSTKPKR